jgi:hypothetical protein
MIRSPLHFEAASTAIGGASAVGAGYAAAKDVALELFGLPLSVVLAAAAGAFLVRSYLKPVGFLRGLWGSSCWTVIACFVTPLAHQGLASGMGWSLSNAALAGVALLVAALGQVVAPVVITELPCWIKRWMRKLTGGAPPADGGGAP